LFRSYLSRRQTIDLISPFFTYPLDGIKPVYIVFSKHTMKVMGVFHFFPILDKGIPVNFLFVYRCFILNRFDRFDLVLGGILVFDLFVNLKVTFLLHVNLHDGISGLVENLKALQQPAWRLLLHRKPKSPGSKKQPLLDRSDHGSNLIGIGAMDTYFLKASLVFKY